MIEYQTHLRRGDTSVWIISAPWRSPDLADVVLCLDVGMNVQSSVFMFLCLFGRTEHYAPGVLIPSAG